MPTASVYSPMSHVMRRQVRRQPGIVVRRSVRGLGSDLRAHGGIFQHEGPFEPYASIDSAAYHNGSLGQEPPDLAFEMRKLTIVVGATGLLVAGILFNQLLQRAGE